MTAPLIPMFPLPADLQTGLLTAGWERVHNSLFACDVDLGASQPLRGVWLTRRAADVVEILRPVALDQGPLPALRHERRAGAGDMHSMNGMLVLVHSLRFPPDIREVTNAAFVFASRTPEEPRELNPTVQSGWSPFDGGESWPLERWWIDEGRTDW